MTYRVTVQIHFCYGHRLLDYVGPCAHPHGHNGLVEIELESDSLDSRGMVFDFADGAVFALRAGDRWRFWRRPLAVLAG